MENSLVRYKRKKKRARIFLKKQREREKEKNVANLFLLKQQEYKYITLHRSIFYQVQIKTI